MPARYFIPESIQTAKWRRGPPDFPEKNLIANERMKKMQSILEIFPETNASLKEQICDVLIELVDKMAGYAGEARKLLASVCKGGYIREKSKSMTAPINGYDIVGKSLVTIKKPHVCFGCGREFKPGNQMEKSLITGDSPWSCYLCATCCEVLKTFPYIEEFGFEGLKQAALDLEQKGKQQNEEIHP